jgi:hypothetical protein
VGFVLCDVSGKGAPAALMTAMIQGVFRGHAQDAPGPAATMSRVNQVLVRRTVRSHFATGFYGILWPDGRFVSSNAGHNPPFLVTRDGAIHRLEKGGIPLGMFERATYEEEEMRLGPGDTLVLFSDGLSEAEVGDAQTADRQNKIFGQHCLEAGLRGLDIVVADRQIGNIVAALGIASGCPNDAGRGVLCVYRGARNGSAGTIGHGAGDAGSCGLPPELLRA